MYAGLVRFLVKSASLYAAAAGTFAHAVRSRMTAMPWPTPMHMETSA